MKSPTRTLDPVRLEVFRHLFTALAEEMGAALRGAAYSPNIKERRDYSCAVFDGAGRVVAMGDHMPVHLGAMPMSVEQPWLRLQTRDRAKWSSSMIHSAATPFARYHAGRPGIRDQTHEKQGEPNRPIAGRRWLGSPGLE